MGILEKNISNSFKKVKQDMDNIQHQIFELKQKVEDIDMILLHKEKKKIKKRNQEKNKN